MKSISLSGTENNDFTIILIYMMMFFTIYLHTSTLDPQQTISLVHTLSYQSQPNRSYIS